jgi:FMN phosphatase YigB (HAD superfamily)
MKYKYIVFDFDGVICDSTNECMVTAWNSWQKFNLKEDFRLKVDEFNKDDIKKFRDLRPYVRGASEYYVLMNAIESKIKIKDQKDFDDLKNRWRNSFRNFKTIFFEQREKLRNNNLDYWIDLHFIYQDVIKIIKKLNNEKRLLIATLKDKKSVTLILKECGISIGSKDILDQAKISTKLEALDYFVLKKKVLKEDLCFIDDNITHLIEPHNNNYKVFLSGWGSTLIEHKNKAKTHKIKVIENINEDIF